MASERHVLAAEPVAPVVTRPALLRPAGGRLDLAGVGLDAEVAVADFELRAVEVRDRTAEKAAGAVDPAVQAVLEAVDAGLVVVRAEAGEELLDDVGLAVAVGVLGVEDVGGGADEHAVSPDGDAGWEGDIVEKDLRRVVAAVPVGVAEDADAAGGAELAVAAE